MSSNNLLNCILPILAGVGGITASLILQLGGKLDGNPLAFSIGVLSSSVLISIGVITILKSRKNTEE